MNDTKLVQYTRQTYLFIPFLDLAQLGHFNDNDQSKTSKYGIFSMF